MPFTHLHVHTEFSLLDGFCKIKELPEVIKSMGQTACAITDHGVMYGVIDFYRACKAVGIKPIIGCEVYVAPQGRTRFDKVHEFDSESRHLVLLCENEEGYRNLSYMVSLAWTEGFYIKPRIDQGLLREHSKGLIALSACLAGEIPRRLRNGEYENAKVFSDIGCYTLGWLSPFHAIDTCVDMGASITMAKGAADAGQHPALAVIGDSTFTHSGMTGLLDAVNEGTNITVVISDNLTTGMTGGQDSAGTGRLEQICAGLGVDPAHIRVVVPLPRTREEMKAMLREEIAFDGVSVIIPRRECIQTAKRHNATKQKQ